MKMLGSENSLFEETGSVGRGREAMLLQKKEIHDLIYDRKL